MYLRAKLKCKQDAAPYRVYINDELITERLYSILLSTTDCNMLYVHLEDAPDYDVKIVSLRQEDDYAVTLHDFTKQETQFED